MQEALVRFWALYETRHIDIHLWLALRRYRRKTRIITGYLLSSCPSWDIWDPVSKRKYDKTTHEKAENLRAVSSEDPGLNPRTDMMAHNLYVTPVLGSLYSLMPSTDLCEKILTYKQPKQSFFVCLFLLFLFFCFGGFIFGYFIYLHFICYPPSQFLFHKPPITSSIALPL